MAASFDAYIRKENLYDLIEKREGKMCTIGTLALGTLSARMNMTHFKR
jgi:hypothetical protein